LGLKLRIHLQPGKTNSHKVTINTTNTFKLLKKTYFVFFYKVILSYCL